MIRDTLLCMNNISGNENIIAMAAKFSVENNARLTGLYILADAVNRFYAYEHLSGEVMQQIIDEEKQQAAEAEVLFHQMTRATGCETTWYCISEGQEPIEAMFYTDLIFMNHKSDKEEGRFSSPGFINHLLLETGRPIVIIPDNWTEDSFGKKIVLGWNKSREAARAMHEALPLMQKADRVDIVTVDAGKESTAGQSSAEIINYLKRHAVSCQLYPQQTDQQTPTIGEVILHHAERNDMDLITIGGYGHSRLRELFLGGVTRFLVHNSDTPLLLVH